MEIKINICSGEKNPSQGIMLQDKLRLEPQVPQSRAKEARKDGQREEQNEIKEIFAAIDSLIGLNDVKNMIYEIHAFTEIQRRRREEQLNAEPTVLHSIFRGNPGSGKTTLARLLARLYKEMGILSKGHLVEVERADLVGEFIGHTAKKTKDQVKKALGGLLFIDEAYSLCRGGEKDFGREAIDALVKAMEDHKTDFVLVLAGYNREMEMFLRANPGLHSRFPLHIDFPDYSRRELLNIAAHMYRGREYTLAGESWLVLEQYLLRQMAAKPYLPGNARAIRNIVESSLRTQAVRLLQLPQYPRFSREMLQNIAPDDVAQAIKRLPEYKRQQSPVERGNLAAL